MLQGCYYRCPIIIEDQDEDYPRLFVLAQVVEYNEIADAVRVVMHDLCNSSQFYSDVFKKDVFYVKDIMHCKAVPGGVAEGLWGKGVIVCRADDTDAEDQPYWYWVKLTDGQHVKACETEMKIEYSQMNYGPEKQLRAYEFQHPTWFLNHLKVSRNLHLINNASYGFGLLAGCRTFLLPHQINTVARCFETLPVRYMLADEVGLGKTVEACSILKIMANENEALRVLIVVPGALIGQWKNELHYKYSLEAGISSVSENLCLSPMEDLDTDQAYDQASWDLVIIDETHRLLTNEKWYEKVQSLSSRIEHILLLSATPIQDRNEEYRKLLALLNPEQYAAMSQERFSWLVKKQKQVQLSVKQQLERLNRYDEFSELINEKINALADTLGDKAFFKLKDAIDLSSEDNGLEQVKQALAYICENYRLERKVIRNRRQLISKEMAKRDLVSISYKPLSMNENYNEIGAIQNTIAYLSEHHEDSEEYIQGIAIPLLSALFSSPWAYEEMLDALSIEDEILKDGVRTWKSQAESEHKLVNVALDEDPDMIKGRLLAALNYIDQETSLTDDENCKLVVFTAFNATLAEFLDLFNTRFNDYGIHAVAFGKHMMREDLEDSIYAFQNNPACRVIICDETGGEGRNFQNASLVIHLDIPWNANTLEQRIGRLDRIGRSPDMDVLSVVIYAQETIEEQLFHVWRDGLKLFEQSLSGLEIITGELNHLIVEALKEDYHTGLMNAFEEILEQADEMRESVEDEQLFDLGATLYRPLTQNIENIISIYNADNDNLFAKAMMGWGSQAGLQAEKPTSTGLIEFREGAFSVNAAKQSLFIPPDWKNYHNASIVKREGKILGSFNRKTAALREDVLFFAPGDAVYDAIITNAIGCSRGRCSAIETTGLFDYTGLIYIFNVVPKLDELIANNTNLHLLSRYRMYLPIEQVIITLPLTASSREVPQEEVIRKLFSLTYQNATHLGRRGASRMDKSPLEEFISANPPSQWEPLIDKYSASAYKRAVERIKQEADIKSATHEMQRVLNGYRAECLYFEREPHEIDDKVSAFQETLRSMKAAKPELDAVCFLRVKKQEVKKHE